MVLSQICTYSNDKISIVDVNKNTYISTENMLPNKAGIIQAASLPSTMQVKCYKQGDVLVSNIRPYFKKIWFAEHEGSCSNDVLVFRAKETVNPNYLFYVLSCDKFFEYAMATSKGTKMPRGDKKTLMEYEIPEHNYVEQVKIAGLLRRIDDKIGINNKINNNLEQQIQMLFQSMFSELYDSSNKTFGDIIAFSNGKKRPVESGNI
ncbi:MAG: restriction endonuclease subunit S, partial [Lachnospira sp.]|nr:restriction endonuclease subunit S [Lachnospira sp.]